MLRMDETAWRRGYLDGMTGNNRNPYQSDSARSWAWTSGYIEGAANPDKLPQMRPLPSEGAAGPIGTI
jgi:ribosome modulation factor